MNVHNLTWTQDRDNSTATTGGATGTTSNAWVSGDLKTGKWYRYYRPIWIFQRDPAVIPSDATITALDLIVNVNSAATTTLRDAWINVVMFHVDGAISPDDYDNFDFANASDSRILSSVSTGNNTFHITNLTAIPSSGDIGFAILLDSDIMNAEPEWGSGCQSLLIFRTAEAGAQYAGRVLVTYEQPPVPEFTATPTNGTAPLTVTFTDTSTNTPTSWLWDFGDGNSTNSTVQNPVHTYLSTGTYLANLTATNAAGSDLSDNTEITVTDETTPVASFTLNRFLTFIPQTVDAVDTSTNTPTSWAWSWGDGTANSTTQNATHIYSRTGIFRVNLESCNAAGCDDKSQLIVALAGA